MSYTPTTWTTGDTITATKLNKIENGIASAGGGVSGLCTDTSDTLDKSYNDIDAMITAGVLPFLIINKEVYYASFIDNDGTYEVDFATAGGNPRNYVASDADDPLALD